MMSARTSAVAVAVEAMVSASKDSLANAQPVAAAGEHLGVEEHRQVVQDGVVLGHAEIVRPARAGELDRRVVQQLVVGPHHAVVHQRHIRRLQPREHFRIQRRRHVVVELHIAVFFAERLAGVGFDVVQAERFDLVDGFEKGEVVETKEYK